MKFQIVNLGCKVNRVESDSVAAGLFALGATLSGENDADLVVVNTCTVTGEAEKKARKAVRHALATHEHATVFVSGCAAAINPSVYQELDNERIKVVSKIELETNLRELAGQAGLAGSLYDNADSLEQADTLRVGESFRTRVNIKIQDGCNNACAYCIVHVARGPERSMPFAQVVSEVASYARAGVREIVLTGINIGSYESEGKKLPELLIELLTTTQGMPDSLHPVRFRISSIEPEDVSDELIRVIKMAHGRICRHFHLPIQAGSTKVLREMNRHYTAQDFKALVDRVYGEIPEMSLSTDIIVGFPGESDLDFEETCAMSRACRFSKIHVFPYSRREGTEAAERLDQVPDDIKKARASILRKLSSELGAQDAYQRNNTTELALVEPEYALTESYHEVHVPEGASVGDLVEIVMSPSVIIR